MVNTDPTFLDFIHRMLQINGGGFFLFFTAALIVALPIVIIAVIAHHVSRVRRHSLDVMLKSQMLERGMSADEIERVIRASPESSDSSAPPISGADPEADLVKHLVAQGYEGEDIAHILEAMRSIGGNNQLRDEDMKLVWELANQGSEGEDILHILSARRPGNPRPAAAPVA